MTQQELDALPEMGGFGYEMREINGQTFRVPFVRPTRVLWTADDEPCVAVDSDGQRWRLGWADGVRYKSRMMS